MKNNKKKKNRKQLPKNYVKNKQIFLKIMYKIGKNNETNYVKISNFFENLCKN